jgi:hypothetical protein
LSAKQRLPPATTLLQASADYLEHELLPTLAGYHRFQTRVSINVLRTVQRELQLAPAHEAAEQTRLAALLQQGGDLEALNQMLAETLAEGRMPLDAPGLVEHLRQTLREGLAINNPKWIASGPESP